VLALLARRLALGVLTILATSVLIFAGTEVLPGDVATAILGQSATPEAVEAIRNQLSLHDPAPVRYVRWLTNFLQGDLGTSLANGRPIAQQVGARLGNTLFLASVAAAVAVPLAILLGLIAAIRANGWFDRASSVASLIAVSFPDFFIAYVLVIVVAVQLGWFPGLASISPTMSFGAKLNTVALPAMTLVLGVLAQMMRMTRASVIGVMSSPYIEMAVLKGLAPWRVVVQHALPNALAPIINVVALNLAYLIVSIIVVEVIFVYPGMGQLMIDAVSKRDVPLVQACGLIFAGTYVSLNMIADILAILSNPRLRRPR
jgi:peptide/nickel transport system permease protein